MLCVIRYNFRIKQDADEYLVASEESGTARCPFERTHNSTTLYTGDLPPPSHTDQFICWHCQHSVRSTVCATIWSLSVRPSVCPIWPQQRRAAGLLLSAVRAGDIDRQRRSPGAAARCRSTALSSKCGQCHVDSRVGEAARRLVFRVFHAVHLFAYFIIQWVY